MSLCNDKGNSNDRYLNTIIVNTIIKLAILFTHLQLRSNELIVITSEVKKSA